MQNSLCFSKFELFVSILYFCSNIGLFLLIKSNRASIVPGSCSVKMEAPVPLVIHASDFARFRRAFDKTDAVCPLPDEGGFLAESSRSERFARYTRNRARVHARARSGASVEIQIVFLCKIPCVFRSSNFLCQFCIFVLVPNLSLWIKSNRLLTPLARQTSANRFFYVPSFPIRKTRNGMPQGFDIAHRHKK